MIANPPGPGAPSTAVAPQQPDPRQLLQRRLAAMAAMQGQQGRPPAPGPAVGAPATSGMTNEAIGSMLQALGNLLAVTGRLLQVAVSGGGGGAPGPGQNPLAQIMRRALMARGRGAPGFGTPGMPPRMPLRPGM